MWICVNGLENEKRMATTTMSLRELLLSVADGAHSTGDLAERKNISRSTAHSYLHAGLEHNLLERRRSGREYTYRIDPQLRRALRPAPDRVDGPVAARFAELVGDVDESLGCIDDDTVRQRAIYMVFVSLLDELIDGDVPPRVVEGSVTKSVPVGGDL